MKQAASAARRTGLITVDDKAPKGKRWHVHILPQTSLQARDSMVEHTQ